MMMDNKGKISIIVAIYNVEHYLEQCVASLMSQTYKNFEIIFVDDASTDSSLPTLERILLGYEKDNVEYKIIRNVQNMGIGYTRRAGMINATGDYLIHVDSDDYVEDTFLEKLIDKAHAEQADIVICNNAIVDNGIVTIKKNDCITNKSELIKRLLIGTFHNGLCNKLISNKIITENNIYPDEFFRMMEDKSILYKCVYFSTKIAYVDEALYYYRNSHGSLTKTKQKSLMTILERITNQIDDFFEEHEADDVIRDGVSLFKLRSSAAFLIYGGPVDKALIKKTPLSKISKMSFLPAKYRCALVFNKLKMNFMIRIMQRLMGIKNG